MGFFVINCELAKCFVIENLKIRHGKWKQTLKQP